MNREQASTIISDTFTQAFDRRRFSNLVVNLLNLIDETKAQSWNKQYIRDAFKAHVSRYERLGTYTSPDGKKLDVLIVHLTTASKLERARTAIRNFVADRLKKRDEKDAALVAFVSPTEKQWRFSYVKMEYAAVEKESGKVGVETRLTPARRFSYIVGEGESCHTAQTRFLGLLQDVKTDPKLADLEEAFSVEAVTKEFFRQYAELFEDIHESLEKLIKKDKIIRDEFTAKNVNTVDFAKKLMGQIVFLYFLQKKGWLGVAKGQDWGTGPHDFLRRLANREYGEYGNFFNDILEPLFYNTLATDRGHEAWCNRFKCRIPFLNGGLFEPLAGYDWGKTDILLPDRLFTNADFVEEGIIGTGVLDVFDRYNFTVNEAEPLEKEVAIDPEMLGKVFENLIEDNRRKGLGAFYTPREIVHYMCQESLINYLDTAVNTAEESIFRSEPKQDKLFGEPEPEQIVLKAAARCEVVPRAAIETFVRLGEQISHYEAVDAKYAIKMPKSIEKNAKALDDALKSITVCDPAVGSGAFPVGMMTEIVRARSTLTPYFNDVHERTPYYFKRHAIQNCLYGVDIDSSAVEIARLRLWLSLVVDEEDSKQIKPLPNLDYKIVTGNSLIGFPFKSRRLAAIEELKQQFFDETDHDKKTGLKSQIDQQLHEAFAGSRRSLGYEVNFDFETYFSEIFHTKDGFDITIANPPYLSHDQITEDKNTLRSLYKTYAPFADLYCYFIERGLALLRPAGILSFITSNSYLKAEYGSNLRSLLSKKTAVRKLLNIEVSQVFSEAIVNVAVLLAQKKDRQGENMADAVLVTSSQWNSGDFGGFVRSESFDISLDQFLGDEWIIEKPEILLVRAKMERAGNTIKQLGAKIRLGIATGCNDAFLVDSVKRKELIEEDGASANVIVPVIRGRDIERYGKLKPQLLLIAAKNGVNVRRDYVAIYRHLHSFGKKFQKRGAQGENWWNLRACAFYDDFDMEKIVWMELTDRARFTNCQAGIWCLNTAYFMLPPDGYSIKYLLAVLNSRAIYFYFRLAAQTSGMGVPRWINIYVERFPIPDAPNEIKKELESKVDRIQVQKERDPSAETTPLEREIDQLVYNLYGLTEEEIAIVEGKDS